MVNIIKDLSIGFFKFLIRVVLAGIVIGIFAGIIYGIVFGLSYLIGKPPLEDYTYLKQYVEVGFWIGLFAIAGEIKSLWR